MEAAAKRQIVAWHRIWHKPQGFPPEFRININRLKDLGIQHELAADIEERFGNQVVDDSWETFHDNISEAAEEDLGT